MERHDDDGEDVAAIIHRILLTFLDTVEAREFDETETAQAVAALLATVVGRQEKSDRAAYAEIIMARAMELILLWDAEDD